MMLPLRNEEDADCAAPAVKQHLERHGLLGYPTETVYGLGSAADTLSVTKLAALKGRRVGKPFLLLVSSRAMADRVGVVFTPAADALSEATQGDIELNLRDGVAFVEVERTAATLREAITTAIREIEQATVGVRVVRVESEAANVIAKINADLLGVASG